MRNSGGRGVAEVRGAVLTQQPGKSDERHEQRGGQRRGDEVSAIVASAADGDCREVSERKDHELDTRPDRKRTDGWDLERRPTRLARECTHEDGDRHQEHRVRECLRHHVAVVDHRGRRDGGRSGEQRVRRPDDPAGEPIRREDGRRHHRRVEEFRGVVRVRHRGEQPRGSLHERCQRRGEEEVFASNRQAVSGGDRL